jgi:putative FmdB family regulatory protein
MPLYEFRCPNGHDFETFYRSIGAAPSEVKCPECGAVAERRISAAGLHFKGSGFYITDYGKDGKKAEREAAKAKTDKPATDAKAAESPPASDAKPAEAAATKKESASAPAAPPPAAKKSE